MSILITQPNLYPHIPVFERHELPLPSCCPISGNPQAGSTIFISYRPQSVFLEVYSLRKYIDQYIGGFDNVRDMEGMIQRIAHDCAQILGVYVRADAHVELQRGDKLRLVAKARPTAIQSDHQLPDSNAVKCPIEHS